MKDSTVREFGCPPVIINLFVTDFAVRAMFGKLKRIPRNDDFAVAAFGDGWQLGFDYEEGWKVRLDNNEVIPEVTEKIRNGLKKLRITSAHLKKHYRESNKMGLIRAFINPNGDPRKMKAAGWTLEKEGHGCELLTV